MVGPLVETVRGLRPDLVAVSGDLTQRARTAEFREARVFLDALPQPQIVVPGNHDVPLHNVISRFTKPLDKYRYHITDDLQPFYVDDEIAALGINTARSLTFKNGRINRKQLALMREKLCEVDAGVVKIVVTHHPFDVPAGASESDVVGRAERAMSALAACGADLFLAGHLHLSHTTQTTKRYKIEGHSAVIVQAGTAVSTRVRGEENSFNVIRIHRPQITVERYQWDSAHRAFVTVTQEAFAHQVDGWQRIGRGP